MKRKHKSLIQKWAPLLERTPEIEGIDKKEQWDLMAQMLENQSKYAEDNN